MADFGRYVSVTIVRNAGTSEETRWETRAGGSLGQTALFRAADRVKTGDEILCPWFDEPRVVTRVDAIILQNELGWWEVTIQPRSEWERQHLHQQSAQPIDTHVETQTFQAECADATARNPQSPKQSATADEAIFRREGKVWKVSFLGKTILLPDSRGMGYIAELLRSPHRPIPAIQLAGLDSQISTIAPMSGMPLADERALKQVHARVAALQAELEQLPENDWLRRGDRREELLKLQAYLQGAENVRGEPRETGGVAERARKAVTNAINRAIFDISAQHPELGQHLAAIKTGSELIYLPASIPNWQF
jgi:hypothetical protein